MRIRTRKRTAAEKKQDKAKKEEKKGLKKQKRKIKKTAREDKKDVKREAREKKKSIRKSDLKGKDKRDAKKDVKEDKKKEIKNIKGDKKDKVKEVKEEIKDVKHSLEVVLPVKTANVALLRADLGDIKFHDGTRRRALTIEDVYSILNKAFDRAGVLARRAYRYLKPFTDLSKRASWIESWNNDALLVTWFGKVDRVGNVSDVHNRMKSVVDRLDKKITIRVHPQRDADTSAQNNGTFFEPKTFKVFPSFIGSAVDSTTRALSYDQMASVMVHELMHVWFTDQKLGDGTKVYGESKAKKLAKTHPKKARRSAENYEHFCLNV